ncbi:MAG: hybrid sensor histidine kinase/response regulator [Steroidobacteraceae bacterium]
MNYLDLSPAPAPSWRGAGDYELEWEVQRRTMLERALAERDRELNDFLENALEGLLKVGPDGTLFWINGAALELLGCSDTGCIGRPIEDFHLESSDARESLRRLLAGETLRDHATSLRRADGLIRHVRIAANARWDAGRLIYSRWFVRDVTHERLAEQAKQRTIGELKRAEEALREADRRKDEFLAVLAHELRNPLAPIRYAVAMARKEGGAQAERLQAQAIIERQVEHMSRLLDDLLDVSRITRGTLMLRRSSVDLAALVAAAHESARPLIEARKHTLEVRLPEQSIRLAADPVRLAQVLSNLLINAAKYTDGGGRIELEARQEGGELLIAVRDNGIGISAQMMPRVFTLFAQASSALERSEGGLGIGLALVRGLVELHGGQASAYSAGTGHGSEFVVRLPLGSPPEVVDDDEDARACKPAKPLRLLVADDNRDSAESFAALLAASGHEVSVAHAGREALELACRLEPDALLLDIGMPELNGYQLAQRIRGTSWGRRAVLIAITGWGQEQDKRRALAAGFDHHLTKPLDPSCLEVLLQSVESRQATPDG